MTQLMTSRLSPHRRRPFLPVLAPVLMMVFWMLLGGAAGIKMMESIRLARRRGWGDDHCSTGRRRGGSTNGCSSA